MSYYRPPDDVPGPDLGREAPPAPPAPPLSDPADAAARRKRLIIGVCVVVDVIIAIVLLSIFVF